MTLSLLLVFSAAILAILNAIGRCPLWVPVFLLALERLLTLVPR